MGRLKLYELERGKFTIKLTNWGATIVSVIVPGENEKLDDIVLEYESLDTYKNETTYCGAIVGCVANKIGGASFKLNGVRHLQASANDGKNTLHGGPKGYGDIESFKKNSHLTFSYKSYEREGFPGALDVKVTYMFIGSNGFCIKMRIH